MGSALGGGRKHAHLPFFGLFVVLLALVGSGIASASSIPVAGTDVSDRVSGSRLETAPDVAVASWAPRDFRNARPAAPPVSPAGAFDIPDLAPVRGMAASVANGPFVPTDTEQFPLRTHGKIFFRVGSIEYVCSGTVISSRGRNVIFTAGHCVYDTESADYVDQLVFVPAYDGNSADPEPFGRWGATAVFTSSRYVETGELSHDIGAVVLEDRIEDSTGARRIAFDLDPVDRQFMIYGYPAVPNPPYDGRTMIACDSRAVYRDSSHGSPFPIAGGPCDMRGGSSGGGWITGGGLLNSVVSYGYCDDAPNLCDLTFGPYFGDQARNIYTYPAVGGSVIPTVGIKSGPRGKAKRSSVSFRFEGVGSTPISFRCRLDGRSFSRCGSKVTFRRLKPGPHVLRVYAVDQTGRKSARTAVRRFGVTGPRR